ncbi:unnamed protein product [Brassica rapa subsp. narinosa]
MADEARETLLEEKEDNNCPGCNIDRLKQEQRGIPYIHLSFIWLVSLCTALPISSLFPYLYFMIRDFHVAEKEEDIGFYAGFVASSFMIGRALTSILWGKLADRYGRKPIILMATFSVIIFNTLFGLSTSFWFAISVRFLLGCVNCLLGVIRAYASEVVSEEYHALSLSVVSTSRGIGLIIGPAIGGYLAQPAEKYPNIFSLDSVFGSFPYFLPSLVISVYAIGALIACWWLPETLHTHCRISRGRLNPNEPEYSPNELNNDGSTGRGLEDHNTQSKPSLLRNRPLMAIIIVYCVFSLQEIAYSEIFSLWAVSDKSYGGLSFSSQDVGQVLAISGLGLLLFQLMVYPPMEKSLGLLVVIRLSAVMLIPLLSCYPSIASLSGLTLHLVINCASILKNALSISLVTGLFILLNKAVPQSQRGAANGLSMTAMSIFKSFGPAGGGILFSWAQKRQTATFLPGTMIDIKECEAFPLKPEESRHLSQDGASAVSLTSSVDLHMVTTSSEANEQVNFSVTEKVLSGEPENCQTVSPVKASNSGIHIAQQPSKHTEDTQQSTQFLHGCPTSEGSKDAVDADAAGQVLPQQCEETILEKNLTEVVDVPETRSILDKDALNEKPKASSLANLRTEAVADCQEEDKTAASGRIMTSATSVSYPADPDAKSSHVLSESVVSESVGYVIRDSASKLVESNSQSDTIPIDKSGTMIDGKECEAFPLKPEESQHLSQDGAPAVSLTSSVDLHMVTTSSEANEQVNFSVTEKVLSGEPENCQTVPPVEASNSGSPIVQQPRKQTEDTHHSPASEGPKDAVDADAAGQVLPQQCEGRILEENLTDVVNVPEFQPVLDNDAINENPSASPLAKTAAGGIMTAATPVSHPTGGVIEVGVSCASTSSEPFVKSHVTGTENAATDLGSHVISSPARKMTELELNKTEDQNTLSLMATESPVLDRNPTSSSGLNLTSDPRKAVEISETTLVSPMVVGSLSKSSLEKTAAKSSKTKSERKPRRTPKSAGKETSRKGNSVKRAAPFQHLQSAGKANAANQSSGSSIQITHSTEKQQSLQTPVLNSFGNLSAPTTSLPDMNSTAPSSIFRRPFTDSQQVQLRAQIFVYGGLIQGTAPDEAYMISAFGGADGGRGTWEKAWRACAVRAQRMRVSSPETPLQSRAGKTETPSMSHTSSKVSSATKPIIPLSSPLWSLSTPLETLQSRSIQRGSAAAPLPSSSHAHQAASVTNIGHNTAWMSPLPYPNPWLASPQTSGFDVGSRFPVFPITESVKLTPTKESSLPYSGGKHVLSGTSGNVFKGTQTLEPASTVVAPAQHSTGTKSRKRKKMPVSVESDPSILNSLQQTEVVVSPLVSISTPVPITAAPGSLSSNAGTLASVDSISAVPINLVSTFPGKKMKSSLQSPIFGGNLVSEVKQRSVLPADTIDKLNEAKMHAEDASALATAAVSHSEYVWKQIEQQRHAGLQPETQGRLASAAVAIAAAAAVAKAAAAAANVAANAAFQAKLMAEEASLPSVSYQGNDLHKSNDVLTQGQGTPASVLKAEGAVVSSSPFLSAAREAAKKRVEAATAATKRAENVESIVKAAELASEAVSQAGILVSMGHPPSLNKLVEVGPSNYWRQAQESEKAQPCKVGVLEKETETTSDRGFASPSTAHTELDGSVRAADGLGLVSATEKKTNGQKGHISADVAKHTAVVFEPEVGSKSSIDTQTESEQIMKKTNDECIKEGSHVEVFKEGPELRTAWYSANVLSLEDGKAYVLFSDLSVEQGTDKLKEWVALKGEGDEAPKIRTARSITALPYEGTRKRRRAAIGDPVWKIGDRVDSWVHDSWLEGVITEKNKNDENTVTVHFPAQGETLTIKAWNLRPSLVWKDGRWIECSTSGENISLSHEGDTPKEKRPRLGAPSPVAEGKDTKMETVVDPDLGKPPQTGVLDLGVSETTFNIGRKEGNPGPLRMKRTGLQTQGAKVIYGVPKPGKTRKFMDVSKHYVSEASNQTRKQKEPAKAVKPIVPQNPGPGSWRLPSKPREKQTTTTTKPKTFKPAPKTKEKPVAAPRIIPRKDSRYTTSSNMESEDAVGQSGENKGPASTSRDPAKGTGEEQITSSSQQGQDTCSQSSTTGKGKVAPTAGRLAKIVEDKASDDNSSKASDGMEPRRSVRRIQPTSRLLEGLQTSMMTSKIPSMSHSRSHQSQRKK